jgi:hypothetical protein
VILDTERSLLTPQERQLARTLAAKIARASARPQLPEGYRRAITEAFGSCDGETDRWQR